MIRKERNKILDDKIESNNNQHKIDRLNAEISAFSSGDLNKYEFLTHKDLKYKPNALDKARFEFSPLGKAFNIGLDKTIPNYEDEGVIKLLKDIRDGLRGDIGPPRAPPAAPGGLDDNDDDNDNNDDEKKLIQKKNYMFTNNLLLKYSQSNEELNRTKNELYETKNKLDKAGNYINEKKNILIN